MDDPITISLTTIDGQKVHLNVLDNDYVRVLEPIPARTVMTAEEAVRVAVALLTQLAPNTLSEDSQ